jgi:hypothetical protein
MPATITTANPLGIGYQTGLFSGTPGQPIDQAFFNAAFAGQINTNKIYKAAYHCNIIQQCGLSQWMEEFGNTSTDCFPEYSLVETYGEQNMIKVAAPATIPVYPATVAIILDTSSTYVNDQFILPQVGNTIVTSPGGVLVKVISINQSSGAAQTITVQQRDTTGNTGATTVQAGDELLVLSGSEILDCACPTGQFAVPDMPIITDLRMISFGDKGEVCGDAIHKCQWLKIPITDDCGNVVDHWYTEALQKMYQRHEKRKFYEKLFNPYFGLVPLVKARGLKWTPASASEITTDDVRAWKLQLDIAGVGCREFAIFAGRNLFSQWQRMLLSAGVVQLNYVDRPMNDCSWLNMEYCGIKVEGLTLHIYDECHFSNGKELGSQNMVFPSSAIIIPMCNRPACNRSNGTNRQDEGADMKMIETVYFKSSATGEVWDNKTDSNGIFGPRNSFGTGCDKHEWTIHSRFLQETHCMNWWGYMGL